MAIRESGGMVSGAVTAFREAGGAAAPPGGREGSYGSRPSASLSSSAKVPQLSYRSSGSLARARASTSFTASGSSGRTAVSRGGGTDRWA